MKNRITIVAVAALSLSACVTPGKRTAIGAGAGAVIGGGVGATKGTKGAVIGAAVGAAAGGALGNYLDRRARELEQVAPTTKEKDGLKVTLPNDLLFETDSSTLTPNAIAEVQKLGDILAKYPDDKLRVSGHTDSRGTFAYNEELSIRRAEAVRRVLTSRGVKDSQMLVLGIGERQPLADNGSAQGRQKNRRVELFIDPAAV